LKKQRQNLGKAKVKRQKEKLNLLEKTNPISEELECAQVFIIKGNMTE